MRVFLTGGTGFIGKVLVDAILRRGWQVTALVRRPDGREAQHVQARGAELARGDITDPASMREAMRGADIVIHNAGWYEFGLTRAARERMGAINVGGTRNVLALALELGVPKIVHVSSMVATGPTGTEMVDETHTRTQPPTSVYETLKAEAHEIARTHQRQGAPVVIASPAGVVGPGDHTTLGYYARLYVRGFCIPLLADGRRATVHVDDCAEGIALSAERGQVGATYLLSGGAQSFRQMFEVWKGVPGGPKRMIFLPRTIGELSCAPLEPLQRLLGLPNIFSREVFSTGSVNWCYSGAKAERELGARFRDPRQAWLDTLEVERQRARAGQGWRLLE